MQKIKNQYRINQVQGRERIMQENPRCSVKIIYSCFDCQFFVNKSTHVDIQKEKYRCMVEKKDFSFNKMSPDGMPSGCPLPYYNSMKNEKMFAPFSAVFEKLEKNIDKK